MDVPQFLFDGGPSDRDAIQAILSDIKWNCEHCMARLDYEASVKFSQQGVYDNPCRGCRLQRYGYGGEA